MVLPADYLNPSSIPDVPVPSVMPPATASTATATSMTDPDSYFNEDMD